MDDHKQKLLKQLQSANATVREEATHLLWHWWFSAAGAEGARLLREVEAMIDRGELEPADEALSGIIAQYPDFAEAWNRRATLRYIQQQHEASLADCREVVRLEPDHFGAWHGMGLCLLALRRYAEAAKAFRRALEIQPFASANEELLQTCLSKLN